MSIFDNIDKDVKAFDKDTKGMFFNTTNETGATLKEYEVKANTQDGEVLEMFNSKYIVLITPEMALRYLQASNPDKYNRVPITSIRRAFSNLAVTEDYFGNPLVPKIFKTEHKVMGGYGRMVYCWKLA